MPDRLYDLLRNLTPEEKMELEAFAAFILARRNLRKPDLLTDDISTEELMSLVVDSGGLDWLDSPIEDVYSLKDGEEIEWPK